MAILLVKKFHDNAFSDNYTLPAETNGEIYVQFPASDVAGTIDITLGGYLSSDPLYPVARRYIKSFRLQNNDYIEGATIMNQGHIYLAVSLDRYAGNKLLITFQNSAPLSVSFNCSYKMYLHDTTSRNVFGIKGGA